MTARRVSKGMAAQRSACVDLFGEVPVTRQDVYAWLMAVAEMDPESSRAAEYIRHYCVLDKIVAAKLKGTFEQIVSRVRASARFRELAAAGRASVAAKNSLGVGEQPFDSEPMLLPSKALKAPRRPAEVIAREREGRRQAKRRREQARGSYLNRLPLTVPPLSVLLGEIGAPSVGAIAHALQVSERTVYGWKANDDAPRTALLALFWLTKWGVSTVEANAHNDALNAQRIARLREIEADELRENLRHIERIADFGSANDPLPNVQARQAEPLHQAAAMPAGEHDETQQRRKACAA